MLTTQKYFKYPYEVKKTCNIDSFDDHGIKKSSPLQKYIIRPENTVGQPIKQVAVIVCICLCMYQVKCI